MPLSDDLLQLRERLINRYDGRHAFDRSASPSDFIRETRRIADRLGAEVQPLRLVRITFPPEDRKDGLRVIFNVGTAIGTGRRGEFLVPERSKRVLDRVGIHYNVLGEE